MELLVKAGADISAKDNRGMTTLYETYDPEVIRYLLDQGADIDARDELGRTPLMVLAILPGEKALKALIEAGADVKAKDHQGNTAIHHCLFYGRADIAVSLVEAGANINAQNMYGKTALHQMKRHFTQAAQVKTLLMLGADPNIQDHEGNTPLHIIMLKEDDHECVPIMDELIKFNAKVNVKNGKGETPLHWVGKERIKSEQFIDYRSRYHVLLDANAEFSAQDEDGQTILHELAFKERDRFPLVFGKVKMDYDIRNDKNESALHTAAEYDNKGIAAALLKKKVEIEAKSADNLQTPLHFAAKHNSIKVMELLIEMKANLNARTAHKQTPLHLAVQEGHEEAVQILLDAGAEVNAVARLNFTPLDFAIWEVDHMQSRNDQGFGRYTPEDFEKFKKIIKLLKGHNAKARKYADHELSR
jgi:ankyrin repeat protein